MPQKLGFQSVYAYFTAIIDWIPITTKIKRSFPTLLDYARLLTVLLLFKFFEAGF
jgi:hypothetical protein